MKKAKVLIIKNDEAGLVPGDVLEVKQIMENFALLQLVPKRPQIEFREAPQDDNTLNISTNDSIDTHDEVM